jgi:hypothetical protein
VLTDAFRLQVAKGIAHLFGIRSVSEHNLDADGVQPQLHIVVIPPIPPDRNGTRCSLIESLQKPQFHELHRVRSGRVNRNAAGDKHLL